MRKPSRGFAHFARLSEQRASDPGKPKQVKLVTIYIEALTSCHRVRLGARLAQSLLP